MGNKHISEKFAQVIFTLFAIVAIVAVCSITVYMICLGTPALLEVGVIDLLFGTVQHSKVLPKSEQCSSCHLDFFHRKNPPLK